MGYRPGHDPRDPRGLVSGQIAGLHFATGLLEYPQYTKPPVFRGLAIPDILVSGHHAQVARWRNAPA